MNSSGVGGRGHLGVSLPGERMRVGDILWEWE